MAEAAKTEKNEEKKPVGRPPAAAAKPRKVVTAHMQAAVTLPGGAGTKSEYTEKRDHGIEMYWVGNGVLVKTKGEEAFIPDTNIKIVHLAKPTAE